MFNGKCLLITGGTGSFGHAVLRRFLSTGIREIRIFSRDEKKQEDQRLRFRDPKLQYYIGDVRDYRTVLSATRGVDYIFHAAALKQVPSCEFYPMEAVQTNVIGTDNVLEAAITNGVRRVVCLSTDKAVYPVNAMGVSKAMMEKVFVAKSRSVAKDRTAICGTRYGNVLASRGSVMPLFVSQIRAKVPITVTDPNMTRFIMSLDEAVDLVVFAFQNGGNGDLLVKKAPAVRIGALARALAELMNVPDHPIRIIGTRHGEKRFETLLSREEMMSATDLGDFYRIAPDNRDLNYAAYFDVGEKKLSETSDYNSDNAGLIDIAEIKRKISVLRFMRRVMAGEAPEEDQ